MKEILIEEKKEDRGDEGTDRGLSGRGRRNRKKGGAKMSVWEESIKDQEERRFGNKLESEGMAKKEERDKGGIGSMYERTCDLLEDFPNLKGGGLLLDPEVERGGKTMFKTQEWTVIVFPWGQGHGRKVTLPDQIRHTPKLRRKATGLDTLAAAPYAW